MGRFPAGVLTGPPPEVPGAAALENKPFLKPFPVWQPPDSRSAAPYGAACVPAGQQTRVTEMFSS